MNFSSIPAYLDPSNWQQQLNHQNGGSSGGSSQRERERELPPPPPPPQLPPQPHGGGGGGGGGVGSIRPGSMADRARMANIPMPETALKCPRCDSSNTKFCYFNNYSLTQPRHFCKTCRRYWTRGGALRNVPVGGGCRRNKRSSSKSNNNKSSAAPNTDHHHHHQITSSSSSSATSSATAVSTSSGGGAAATMLGLCSPQFPPLRFMPPLHHQVLSDYGGGVGDHIGLNYSGISASDMNLGSIGGGGGGGYLGQNQIPSLLGGMDVPTGLYPFLGGGMLDHHQIQSSGYGGGGSSGEGSHQVRPKFSGLGLSQMGSSSVKMEDNNNNNNNNNINNAELNLSRQFLGGISGNDHHPHHQYWNNSTTTGNAWTDLSGFSTSSSSNPL